MPDPTKYTPGFSYTGYESHSPKRPKPGPELDDDFAGVSRSVNETIDALKDIRRSDGKLNNGIVTNESLDPEVLLTVDSAVVAAVEAAQEAREAAAALAGAVGTVQFKILTVAGQLRYTTDVNGDPLNVQRDGHTLEGLAPFGDLTYGVDYEVIDGGITLAEDPGDGELLKLITYPRTTSQEAQAVMTSIKEAVEVISEAPVSWADFARFEGYSDGKVVWFNGVQFVRDRSANISGLAAGSGWVPAGDVTMAHFPETLVADSLEQAAAAAVRLNRTLRLSGTVTLNRIVALPGDLKIVCEPNFVIRNAFDPGDNPVVTFGGGGVTALPNLSADVVLQGQRLTFATAHGLAIGDYIAIENPTDASWNGRRNYYRAGEYCQVEKIISTTEVRLLAPTYDAYASTDVVMWKVNPTRLDIQGKFKVRISSGSSGYGVYLREVVASDVSAFDVEVDNGMVIALGFIRCVDLTGTGTRAIQGKVGEATSTDYGIYSLHSQGVKLWSAVGHGRRHAFTTSGGGGVTECKVVNRDCIFDGTWSNAMEADDSVNIGAGDFHGNTEYCTMSGKFFGGISPAGDKNTYRGTSIAGPLGLALLASEMKGCNHDFRGMRFECQHPIYAAGTARHRPVYISATALSAHTTKGGILDFRDCVFATDTDATTAVLIEPGLRNATATNLSILFDETTFEKTSVSMTACVEVDSASYGGLEPQYVGFFGSRCMDNALIPIASAGATISPKNSLAVPTVRDVPLYERGANANGEYVKYADGTLICTRYARIDCTNTDVTSLSYPAPFLAGTKVAASMSIVGNAANTRVSDYLKAAVAADENEWEFRMDSAGTRTDGDFMFTAIGRWK